MPSYTENDLTAAGGMAPNDFHYCIERTKEVASNELFVRPDLRARLAKFTEGLLISDTLLAECTAALKCGNLVLQGPPGTGKSSIARALAKAFCVELMPVTAHEDWSTFEVIGRHELQVIDGKETIKPVNGHFTEAAIRCAGNIPSHQDDPDNPDIPQATWLMIDELNRAHPDKAFGELFSVLGTDEPVEIILAHQPHDKNRLTVPRRFRIIATVNSIDKQFVNSLSMALRRRFTFVTMDVPTKRRTEEEWTSSADGASQAVKEFALVRRTALARVIRRNPERESDIKTYVENDEVITSMMALFDLVERVRYAKSDADEPYVPIGTATLLDTIELMLVRASGSRLDPAKAGVALDWAVSVKIAPLFDVGSVAATKLGALAKSLAPPLKNGATARALKGIASDGLYYIK